MALQTIYISGTPGLHYAEDSRLNEAAEIMLLMREGKGYKEVSGTPTGRQFKRVPAENRVYFDVNMPFASATDSAGTVDISTEELIIQIKI